MTIIEFINEAMNGGWRPNYWEDGEKIEIGKADIFLDPKAWQAVGKVKGWMINCEIPIFIKQDGRFGWKSELKPQWWIYFVMLPAELSIGKSIEEYIADL